MGLFVAHQGLTELRINCNIAFSSFFLGHIEIKKELKFVVKLLVSFKRL